MAFCPICNAHHDPKRPCIDRTNEVLRDIGIEKPSMPKGKFKNTEKLANKIMLVVLLAFTCIVLMVIFLSR